MANKIKNKGLRQARAAKKDEFYTTYEDIQVELNHYENKFANKTVLCNCDDPFESNFCKFFLRNFNYLNLKRLICTSYISSPIVGSQMSLFDSAKEPVKQGSGYVMDISEVPMTNDRGVSDADIDTLLKSKQRGVKKLKGSGDFLSDECIEYLKQADIVVTNPPFSLFKEYVAQLIEYKKDFLIIGNVNAITYKSIFPLIKDNKIWLGASIHSGDRKFYVPDNYPLDAANCGIDHSGRKYIRIKGVRWFTSLDYSARHEDLILYKHYYGNEESYPKYDNYDAINVDKVSDIPCDYVEDVGVPITYLDKHNPDQFEVVKFRKGNDGKDLTYISEHNTIVTDRQTDRQTENYALLQNHHQTQNVVASWECRSHSLINTTQSNSQSSGLIDTSQTIPSLAIDLLSVDKKRMLEFSSRRGCNGIVGVPITFLDKYSPDQFEIIGLAAGNIRGLSGLVLRAKKDGPYIKGKLKYGRIFIKRRIQK